MADQGVPGGVSLPRIAGGMVAMLALGAVAIFFVGQDPRPRHLVLVVLDTVRADRLSCYGHSRPTTPNLDRFAAQGLRFDQARAAAPWTLPSHASLFTGRLPDQHGCHWEHRHLSEDLDTLAETLARDHGMETVGITSNVNVSRLYNMDQGFERFEEVWSLRASHPGLDDSAILQGQVEEWLSGRDPARPFFLFLNYMDAHLPYDPPRAYLDPLGSVSEEAWQLAARPGLLEDVMSGEVVLDARLVEELGLLYDAELRKLDERVGLLLDLFDRLDLTEETFFVITSDHGELLGEEVGVDHQLSLHEAVLHVPLLVRDPDRIPPGVVTDPVSLVDLYDWFREAALLHTPEWTPPPEQEPAARVAQVFRPVDVVEALAARGVATEAWNQRQIAVYLRGTDWKYRAWSDGRRRLSRLGEGEDRDQALDHPEVVERAEEQVERLGRRTPFQEDPASLQPERASSDLTARELAQLGYVHGRDPAVGVHAAEHRAASQRALAEGLPEQAWLECQRALALAPDWTELLLDAADLAQAAGRDPTDWYRRALKSARGGGGPRDPRLVEAQERVQARDD